MAKFTLKDAQDMERKYGKAYFVTTDGMTLIPATHVGVDRIGVVSTDPHRGELINWSVKDATGKILLHGCEQNLGRSKTGWFRAVKTALKHLHGMGCTQRVRPGDHRSWSSGAAYV